ncbi:nascent polypeptide-associated complex subunit alpha, muscle-specific form-like [Anolis carolinensis]|uniref:nascent polypeptide-associated complex subunit alpha, muscle-specific form-like n=1 Tax=Anolis carolinensis TaxID=28377 RepID=UPI002F2B5C7C
MASFFKKCDACGGTLPEADGHAKCLLCLGESHNPQSCQVCRGFTPQARKNRESRLKALLYEQALAPNAPGAQESRPSPSAAGGDEAVEPSCPPPREALQSITQEAPGLEEPTTVAQPSKGLKEGKKKTKKTKHLNKAPRAKPLPQCQSRASLSPRSDNPPPLTPIEPQASQALSLSGIIPAQPVPSPPSVLQEARNRERRGRRSSSSSSLSSPPPSPKRPRRGRSTRRRRGAASASSADSSSPPREGSTYRYGRASSSAPCLPYPFYGQGLPPYPFFPPGFDPWEPYRQFAVASAPARSHASMASGPTAPLEDSRHGHAPTKPAPLEEASQRHTPAMPMVRMRPGTETQAEMASTSGASLPRTPVPPQQEEAPSGVEDKSLEAQAVVLDPHDVTDPGSGEDFKTFSALLVRLSRALNLPAPKPVKVVEDPVYPSSKQHGPLTTSLPSLPYLIELVKNEGVSPASLPATPRRAEFLYKIELSGAQWLAEQPRLNSKVVDATQPKAVQRSQPTPTDKEGKKLESMGKKFYSSACLFARMAHFTAYTGAYQSYLWEKMAPYIDLLPMQDQALAKAFQQEACLLSEVQKELAKNVADASGKLLAGAISLRRHAWLRAANLSPSAKSVIEDLPLDEAGIFNPDTDAQIKDTHEVTQAAHKYGVQQTYYYQRRRWGQYYRSRRSSSPAFRGRQRPSFRPSGSRRPSFPFKSQHRSAGKQGEKQRRRF